MFNVLRAAGTCLLLMLTSVPAIAQQAPVLVPPVAPSNTDVPYPEGAEGDAAVVLELVVEKDGTVSEATVVEGGEPFAEQARTAALGWRFTPARRGDQLVAARVRARVTFQREPDQSATPAAPAEAASTAPPTPKSAMLPVEITVVGLRRDIGQTTLSKAEVREMPGAFGDAFRAIEALPGVTPLASGVPYFYVRGAPPNNAGYFLDGIRVPLLFHLGLAQGVIHPGLIERVDFFPSAAPARYGGFAGGIVAGRTREPATKFRGEANLRLVDAGALLEAPFADGRGSALVAGRYGFPGPVMSAVSSDLKIDYWDYQARARFRIGDRDSLSVFAFGSHDYLATRPNEQDPRAEKTLNEEFVSDFHRLDLRYDHELTDGRVRVALTGGFDSQGAEPSYLTARSLGARLEVEHGVSPSLRFRGGADAHLEVYGMRLTQLGPREPAIPHTADPPPTNLGAAVHADFVWRASDRVELVPGARFDLYGSSRGRQAASTQRTNLLIPALDPRLSARVTLARGVAWLSSFGLSHQYPSLRVGNVPAPLLSVAGFPFGERQLQSAAQASQGVELVLPADLTLSVTGFYSNFWGLTDLSASCFQYQPSSVPLPGTEPPPPAPYVCPNNDPVRGRGYGLEVMLRRALTKRWSGLLSYTLSRATREAHFLTPTGEDEVATVANEFDRTHVFNAIVGYDLGRRWRAGARLLFYTGTPYSQLEGSVPVPPYHAYRNPAFHRVDVRLEKRWRLGRDGSIAFVLEGQNVTLSKERSSLGMDCEGRLVGGVETTTCEYSTIGPLTIPSVGVEAFF